MTLSQATIEEFCQSDVEWDLSLVPGLGPKSVEKLQAAGVKSTFNLIGRFMAMWDEERSTQANCNDFYWWLGEVGVAWAYKDGLTRLLLEKLYVMLPGMLDMTGFEQ